MSNLPRAALRILDTQFGRAIGASFGWDSGQYCALHAARGVVGCGIFDIACADEFGMAFAIAKGTPEHPLREPEDLYEARIVAVSRAAAELGIGVGMTGLEALGYLQVSGEPFLATGAHMKEGTCRDPVAAIPSN